ncbi:MAG: MBL fold metallo-hydrolase, partial [Kordiimonadaceae bacterium]|nr:MBL fold metallo-hydrolase [Kordiimonadaceae bacterium]
MQLTFLGATGTVTGSKYLFEYRNKKILIDCGLFQGFKELRLRNWEKLPVDPSAIDAVILTHAHIDHSGYIPLLIKNGFKGSIYCSEATYDLCKILLPDSGYLHEEDARRANRYGYTRHSPALALYTRDDAIRALDQFKVVGFGHAHYIDDDLHFTLSRSGHILGSSFISLKAGSKTICFSGDLGRPDDPIMKSPAILQHADYLL